MRGGGAEGELGGGLQGRRAPTLQEGNLDVPAIQGNSTPVLQLQEAVVRAGQADGDGAGADRIRVIGTLPGGACRGVSPPPPAQPPAHALRERPQPGSLSFAHSEPLSPQDSRPKGNQGPGSSRSPGRPVCPPLCWVVQKKEVHMGHLGPHPRGHPGAAWRAHLNSLYDDREGVVLAVLGQQVLADPAEGEVPVVKALEVGLSCDETLSWGDRGRGE